MSQNFNGELKENNQRVYSPNNKPTASDLNITSKTLNVDASESVSQIPDKQNEINIENKGLIEGIQKTLKHLSSASIELRTDEVNISTTAQKIPFIISIPSSDTSIISFNSRDFKLVLLQEGRYILNINMFMDYSNKQLPNIIIRKYHDDEIKSTNIYPFNSFSDSYIIDVPEDQIDTVFFDIALETETSEAIPPIGFTMVATAEGKRGGIETSDKLQITSIESLSGTAENQQQANIQYVNHIKANEAEINNKRSIITQSNQVYTTDTNGNQSSLAYNSGVNGNIIVQRDELGNVKVPFIPIASTDAVSNDYLTKQIATRAPTSHAFNDARYGTSTSTLFGHVSLSDSVNSTLNVNNGAAATPFAVRTAYNRANDSYNLASKRIYDVVIGIDGNGYTAEKCDIFIPSGTTNCQTFIQDVIDNLSNGGNIFLRRGTYNCSDRIALTKNLNIIGEGRNTTNINTNSSYVMRTEADYISVNIENLSMGYIGSAASWYRNIYVYYTAGVNMNLDNIQFTGSRQSHTIDIASGNIGMIMINKCVNVQIDGRTSLNWENIAIGDEARYVYYDGNSSSSVGSFTVPYHPDNEVWVTFKFGSIPPVVNTFKLANVANVRNAIACSTEDTDLVGVYTAVINYNFDTGLISVVASGYYNILTGNYYSSTASYRMTKIEVIRRIK